MNLKNAGDEITLMIKQASFFPYRTGHLRNNTIGQLVDNNTYLLKFDGTIVPYLQFLEEGTTAHNIFNAFGRTINSNGTWNYWEPYKDGVLFPFGIGGRFNGKFHPGSTKHYHFIQDKTIDAILMYFIAKYNGEVRL